MIYLYVLMLLFSFQVINPHNYYTYNQTKKQIIVESVCNETENHIPLDTIYADGCTIVGNKIFTLTNESIQISSTPTLFITEYSYENNKLNKVKEYELAPSREAIQIVFSLDGGYLQLTSLRALAHKNVKPHGLLIPFSEEEMTGEKKVLNIPLREK